MNLNNIYDTRPFDETDIWMTIVFLVIFAVVAYLGYRNLSPNGQEQAAPAETDAKLDVLADKEVHVNA